MSAVTSVREPVGSTATRRTMLALAAACLGVFPLKGLFSDNGWLIDAWLSMVVVVAPAALIRRRRPPGALDIWPGIVLLVPWLTARFLGGSAALGFIPTSRTWDQLSNLLNSLHQTTRDEVAPIHTTVAVRLVICALLGLLAALVDLIAVVGRRGALAGVPLLVVYTVSGAVPRKPVSWVWFVIAAAGYLLLLSLDANDDLEHWGRRVRSAGSSRVSTARTALSVSTPRIAAAALVAAVLLPVLVPGDSRNLLANAFHGGGNGVGGFGGSGGGKISPFAALKGQLDKTKPVKLATVHMTTPSDTAPFYLRVNVLSKYSDAGWGVAAHGDTIGTGPDNYATSPDDTALNNVSLSAQVKISGMRGNPPVFALPRTINGLDGSTTWSPQDQILLGSTIGNGDKFTESFSQPSPSVQQLKQAPDEFDESLVSETEVPPDLPVYVKNLVGDVTNGMTLPYQKARALSDYFADPSHGFTYDLKTQPGDSGSALVDFLENGRGYCQQFAAALAVMLRYAGVPARVVLGYTHPAPDKNGNFTITTSNAHSWVEAYFSGIGWIPFDPTPASNAAGGSTDDLAWAPHTKQTAAPSASVSAPKSSATAPTRRTSAAPSSASKTPAASSDTGSSGVGIWLLAAVAVLFVIGLVPAFVRWTRRRRRYQSARHGDTDALWAELSDSAVDLGYVWSPARSPRQVADWLSGEAASSSQSLRSLAVAVEHSRYSPAQHGGGGDGERLVSDLRDVTGQLRAGRGTRTRLRAALWPASLGWTSRWSGRRRL